MKQLIGLHIIAIRGIKPRKNAAYIPTNFLMFNDNQTYIELEDQDYFSYHDCSSTAKEITIIQNSERWKNIMAEGDFYGDATCMKD